jgi:mRNA-degrading endonuclease toxin of MazEF toxin-antitoxin module
MKYKDYREWTTIKKDIHNNRPRPFFYEREIWFCSLGENIGFEQDGKGKLALRPVIIVKKFNEFVVLIVPLTRTQKAGKYYYTFTFQDQQKSTAIVSQVRMIDSKRLRYKIDTMPESHFVLLKQKIRQFFA